MTHGGDRVGPAAGPAVQRGPLSGAVAGCRVYSSMAALAGPVGVVSSVLLSIVVGYGGAWVQVVRVRWPWWLL